MARCLLWALILAFSSSASLASAAGEFDFAHAEWEELKLRRGVRTFRWRPSGQDLFAFKGIGVIDAPIPKIASLFEDWKQLAEWVPDLLEARLVRRVNATERVQYMRFETPFVVKDRDFVIRSRAHLDPQARVMRIEFHSVLDEAAPETGNVRGRIVAGEYLLESLGEDARTRVTIQVHLDPRGSVPRWLVNRLQRSYPEKTISALRERCAREDVPDHPLVRAMLDGELDPQVEAGRSPDGF